MWEDESRAVGFDLIVNPYTVPIGKGITMS